VPLFGSLGTLVKGGSEALADLPHTAAQLVSLEEQDEDELVLDVSLEGIEEGNILLS